jgi:hypothetical protein
MRSGFHHARFSAGESAIKILSTTITLAFVSAALSLTGCSGFQGATFPPITTQTPLGTIQGSVFGGHAPIVNSYLFVLEATATGSASTGYATMAKSLLSASSTGTSGTYPVTLDSTVGSLTHGLYYITTDASGAFSVSGDYTCDIGDPVYLYASGGTQDTTFLIGITATPIPTRRARIPTPLPEATSCSQDRPSSFPVRVSAESGPR